MAKINQKNFFIQVDKQLKGNRAIRSFVKKEVQKRVDEATKNMLQAFDNHPVTKEIEAGPTVQKSKFLEVGNLFSFIGFPVDAEPTKEVRKMLQKKPVVKEIHTRQKFTFRFQVFAADKQDIFDETPLPWESGRSWVRGIESGISGFGRFMFFRRKMPPELEKHSRSKRGLQRKRKLRSGRFKPVKYMTVVFDAFKGKFV